jgi:putative tryptophan/tyrosine transport system substrate-binding protein
MMRRREVIALLGGAAAWPFAARPQQPAMPVIGILTNVSDLRSDAFRKALRELHYIEGQNLAIEWRFSGDEADRLPGLAEELVGMRVNVIVATSTAPARAARAATNTIPIVFVAVSDPVELGLVKSLARPGGNITGLSNTNVELSGKRLEILREALPGIRSLAVMFNPTNPVSRAALAELDGPARTLGIELHPFETQGAVEVGIALATMIQHRPDALFVGPDPLFLNVAREIGDFSIKEHIPTLHTNREHVEAGGLVSYGPKLSDMYRRAATYVDKILKGARPADLPVEQPTKFELVVNLRTAKALGLMIPESFLLRADEVIE